MILDLIPFLFKETIVHQNTKLKWVQNMLIGDLSRGAVCWTYNLLMDVGKREEQHVYFLD